jgi:hypothetical protein
VTTQAVAAPHAPDAATDDSRSRRLLALAGIAFVPLFLIGWFASNGLTPDYSAADQEWVSWADDNQTQARISGFAMLLAAFFFLFFMSGIRASLFTQRSGPLASWTAGKDYFRSPITDPRQVTHGTTVRLSVRLPTWSARRIRSSTRGR